jgi:hypothetical protein
VVTRVGMASEFTQNACPFNGDLEKDHTLSRSGSVARPNHTGLTWRRSCTPRKHHHSLACGFEPRKYTPKKFKNTYTQKPSTALVQKKKIHGRKGNLSLGIQPCGHECPPCRLESPVTALYGQFSHSIQPIASSRTKKQVIGHMKPCWPGVWVHTACDMCNRAVVTMMQGKQV